MNPSEFDHMEGHVPPSFPLPRISYTDSKERMSQGQDKKIKLTQKEDVMYDCGFGIKVFEAESLKSSADHAGEFDKDLSPMVATSITKTLTKGKLINGLSPSNIPISNFRANRNRLYRFQIKARRKT